MKVAASLQNTEIETGNGKPMIRLNGVSKWYGTRDKPVHALEATDLDIADGELIVLLGPSGCGKTTLLRMIGGLLDPTEGTIRISDADLWKNGQRQGSTVANLGMVFQEANLFPWETIENNIALPLKLRGVSKADRLARAHQLMDLVKIKGFEKRWPKELSGGMRQRAAIARALSYDPSILLMDEPFGALDAMTRDNMNLELQRIWQQTGKTIIVVTHSISEAVFLADRIVLLSPRPGKIDSVYKVNFPRPRTLDIQATPEFQTLAKTLRHRLAEME